MQNEVAKLRPQMELVREEALKSSTEMQKVQCEEEKAMKQQAERVKREVDRSIKQAGDKSRKKSQQELERVRRQMHELFFDI